MFFGIDMEKIVIILVVAALLLGPEKLPRYAELLAKFTVRVRDWLTDARSRVRDEMGEDFDDIEWRKLDPRQYDPRRIIREALLEEPATAKPNSRGGPTVQAPRPLGVPLATSSAGALEPLGAEAAPEQDRAVLVRFDNEAT